MNSVLSPNLHKHVEVFGFFSQIQRDKRLWSDPPSEPAEGGQLPLFGQVVGVREDNQVERHVDSSFR